MTNDTPILFIIQTCAGGTGELCTNNIAKAAVKHGWRAVVFNNRCCSGAPITSARLMIILFPDDIEWAIKHIRENFNPKHMFMIGFSFGAYQVVQYTLSVEGIDVAACISHTYNPVKAESILHEPIQSRLYQPIITAKLIHFAKKKKKKQFLNCPEAENAKTMLEFDEALWRHGLTKYKNGTDLYESLAIYDKIPKIKVPTLLLGSTDDPFTSKDFMPIKEIEKSNIVVLVSFPDSGHVSLLTGNEGNKPIIDTIVPDWFETVIKTKI